MKIPALVINPAYIKSSGLIYDCFKNTYRNKPIIEYSINHLKNCETIGKIYVCSSQNDNLAIKFCEDKKLDFFPLSEKIDETIYNWLLTQKCEHSLIFMHFSILFDKKTFNELIQNFIKSNLAFGRQRTTTYVLINKKIYINNIWENYKTIKRNPDFKQNHLFYNSEFFSSILNDKKYYYNHLAWYMEEKSLYIEWIPTYLPYMANTYISKIQEFFYKNPDEWEKFIYNSGNKNTSIFRYPYYIHTNDLNNLKFIQPIYKSIANFFSFFENSNFKNKPEIIVKIKNIDKNIIDTLKKLSNTPIHLIIEKFNFEKLNELTFMFNNKNIQGIIFKYMESNKWENLIRTFLNMRKIHFLKQKIFMDWHPKIGILFDIDEIGEEKFDNLSKKWDFRRVVYEIYHRNLEKEHFWPAFYKQDIPYPEHIILKYKSQKYFLKRFFCKWLQSLNINEEGNIFICPKINDIIGNIKDFELMQDFMQNKKRITLINKITRNELTSPCKDCNIWYDPF